MVRSTRRLRTLRGGGTSSWAFDPSTTGREMNNPMAWSRSGCGGSVTYAPPPMGGGLPGLSTGQGVSLQKGGGGGTHYGFLPGGGLAGGNASIPTNCALPRSGADGSFNVPIDRSPLATMAGGRRRKQKSRQQKSRQQKSRQQKSRQQKSRQQKSRQQKSRKQRR
jgi:hypothetical protein